MGRRLRSIVTPPPENVTDHVKERRARAGYQASWPPTSYAQKSLHTTAHL